MARDPDSAAHAARLGRPVDVLTTDVVFALDPPAVLRSRDVVMNVSGLLWQDNPHVPAERYQSTVLALCRSLLAEGRRLTLLAHVLDHSFVTDNDVPAVHAVAAVLQADGSDVETVVPESLTDARDVLGSATAVIGSRMHACLNALSAGVPAVPMAYSRKFAPLLAALNWSAGVDLRTTRDPVAAVLAALREDDLTDRARQVKLRAEELLVPAVDVLRNAVGR